MQNAQKDTSNERTKPDKVNNVRDLSSTPHSTSNSSPAKSETETYSEERRYMSDSSESDEDSVSEVESFMFDQEYEEDTQVVGAKFLLNPDEDRAVDPETQARLENLLKAAGISEFAAKDGKHLADPEVLRRLTSSVSCALDEAAAALTRMRSDNPRTQQPEKTSLVEACTDGDVGTVKKLLTEGRSVHETSEEGESLLSLACSAGYYELAQVLLAMHANVEDRGIKGDCTPLMEAASAGHLEIVKLLIKHGADVNAQSSSGNTPLMYACAGGHTAVAEYLLNNGANVEDHNENGHTPLMEAASAGHVGLARILLKYGAGINTHSNEFKESALTLACYKGHLDMVRFLLDAGADQEHKTDEMHTALMEASMDGHVEVARLLLDSGAQVNMPTDSFESPLTLAACGGHVDLAMLLIERGANIEEVNDEGYTPLMEAAREGHEEMVHLLLGQGEFSLYVKGANINAQTDETQETALTLACCGGFIEVADILLKSGADIELGASTPLMEASQEGHLDLVKFLLEKGANVHAQTQTGDTALTYACENGHTDVADLLLQYGADLEHESEGGRTPLMKACRAGHLCTVQFLITKGADVNRQTTNNDHTPLSLACAGGHLVVVELLLSHNADPTHKLKDNSTMLIEAAKGGHTAVVQLLLDYPCSLQMIKMNQQGAATAATNLAMLPGQVGSCDSPLPPGTIPPNLPPPTLNFFQPPPAAVLQEVPEAVRIVSQDEVANPPVDVNKQPSNRTSADGANQTTKSNRKMIVPKSRSNVYSLSSRDAQQIRTQLSGFDDDVFSATTAMAFLNKDDAGGGGGSGTGGTTSSSSLERIDIAKNAYNVETTSDSDDGTTQKQQILEELHRVERELHGKQAHHGTAPQYAFPSTECDMINLAIHSQQGLGNGMSVESMFPSSNLQVHNAFYTGGGTTCLQSPSLKMATGAGSSTATTGATAGVVVDDTTGASFQTNQNQPAFYFTPLTTSVAVSLSTTTTSTALQSIKYQMVGSHVEVSQSTAISDRPKAKPASKKEGKNPRKQLQHQYQTNLYAQPSSQIFNPIQLQQQQQQQQQQQTQMEQNQQQQQQLQNIEKTLNLQESLNVQGLDLDSIDQDSLVLKDDVQENLLTTAIFQQFHSSSIRAAFVRSPQQKTRLELYDHVQDGGKVTKLELTDKDFSSVDDVVQTLESFNASELNEQNVAQHNLQVQPYPSALDETMIASFANQPDLPTQTDLSPMEYFTVQANTHQLPVHALYPYEYLAAAGLPTKEESGAIYQAGFQAGINMMQQLACPSASASETLTTTSVVPTTVGALPGTSNQPQQQQQYITAQQQQQQQQQNQQSQQLTCAIQAPCSHLVNPSPIQTAHHCQVPCSQHQIQSSTNQQQQSQQQITTHQVQAATQTPQTVAVNNEGKKSGKGGGGGVGGGGGDGIKMKKGRVVRHQNQNLQAHNFQQNQNYQVDQNTAIAQYNGANQQQPCANQIPCVEVDSQTESNHDTALTLACAGGHEELVELLLQRKANIEHRDKKGFTPLILAATAGHEKVVEILLNNNADIEAQSERTKDTPLSLACSGGRYEVVELLLNRNANKEHRNVSDYTPLSLAASGGYVNIVKLLLNHGAEINSRTGSKLGISPLMLAAMNGHTAAVKLLLDMGSDINAQIETNRNTALTLACFQGRHEVVSLLLDRKANVEHRAKTGLTPLMEAASGGYVEVGRVLLDKGADVNATPVPSSRDTALTIAADKGHVRFVELLLCRGAQVEVKNKKGNSPLWLAANGGHLAVVELLYNMNADIDSQDNRKVSCLMAAFRKGHVKVVKWMVHHVTQFPSDQEMIRYISTVSDKELLEKCQECVKIIRAAKETQAAKANKNATILLEELDMEKNREESKRLAAARRRERKKKKKLEKKEERRKLLEENKKNENYDEKENTTKKNERDDEKTEEEENAQEAATEAPGIRAGDGGDKEEGDSGIDANSQGSCSSTDLKPTEKRKDKKKKKNNAQTKSSSNETRSNSSNNNSSKASSSKVQHHEQSHQQQQQSHHQRDVTDKRVDKNADNKNKQTVQNLRKPMVFEATKSPAERDDFEATGNENYVSNKSKKAQQSQQQQHNYENDSQLAKIPSPKQMSNKREEGWKEVVRKSSVQAVSTSESGVKKVSVPLNAISRVIGRGGSNINAIRAATGAHIEVEKQSKGQGERIITIKGSSDATKQAHSLIATLIKDPDVDILQMLPKANKTQSSTTTLWDKTQIGTKKATGKVITASQSTSTIVTNQQKSNTTSIISSSSIASSRSSTTTTIKPRGPPATTSLPNTRATAPRLAPIVDKSNTSNPSVGSASATITANVHPTHHPTNNVSSAVPTSSVRTSSVLHNPSSTTTGRMLSKPLATAPSTVIASSATVTPAVVASNAQHTSFAAKLTETTVSHQLPNAPPTGPKVRASNLGVQSNIGSSAGGGGNVGVVGGPPPVSPQPNPNIQSSPKHTARPGPTASAPPTMQHFQSPGKTSMFTAGTIGTAPSSTATTVTESTSTIGAGLTRTTTPTIVPNVGLLPSNQEDHNTTSSAGNLQISSEYSLFYSGDQPMWRRDDSHQKPVNFAAVTGGGGIACSVVSGSVGGGPSGPPKFMEQEPPPVDVSKAPGYRGGAVCSPVSSKTSSNSTTPPNIAAPSVGGNAFHVYQESAQKNQPQLPLPIGSNIVHSNRAQASQNDLSVSNGHFYSDIFKGTTANLQHAGGMLGMTAGDGPLLQSSYHPGSLSFAAQQQQQAQQQQATNIQVSMSRLNPKAPDFSSSVYNSMATKQAPPPIFNGFPLPNQNNSGMYPGAKGGSGGGASDGFHRLIGSSSQSRWTLMQMQQPFTQQQTELISGMATGMTLHNLARATGSEILENGNELGIVNSSPTMSPNLGGATAAAVNVTGGGVAVSATGNGVNVLPPTVDAHPYMEDSRKPPQPIGTERGRKVFNPHLDGNYWVFGDEAKAPGRWPNVAAVAAAAAGARIPLSRGQMYAEEMPQVIDTLPHGLPLETPHTFSNGPTLPYMMQQQLESLRPLDYIQVDALKMDLPWDPTRSNMNDLQDKQPHGWTGMSNKWNQ